jgi:hypothetical protein
LYNGQELPEAAASIIAATLMDMGIISDTDQCTIVYKDAESIADAVLAKEKASHVSIRTAAVSTNAQERIVAAVAHIGKLFQEEISRCKRTRDYTPLALRLIVEADRDENVRKSIEILSTEDGIISKDLAHKYGFTDKIINVIKSVYYNH